jgi:hypothetical protein
VPADHTALIADVCSINIVVVVVVVVFVVVVRTEGFRVSVW